ncbi:hypothetical protein V512_009385 [Mesotoga sp. Brook.08.105.5.1]|jgi:hypothetical protein|nr:hypothetical protein V512_009385 [Mesotoga sp. Brook.08.105.5.1]RAO96186.1 hypothetical protein M388_14945 [Mesotoga sp. Brook.08.YT.4.2.5.4.]
MGNWEQKIGGTKRTRLGTKMGTPFLGTRAVPRSDAARPGSWQREKIIVLVLCT